MKIDVQRKSKFPMLSDLNTGDTFFYANHDQGNLHYVGSFKCNQIIINLNSGLVFYESDQSQRVDIVHVKIVNDNPLPF